MWKKKKTGSMICPACGKLISADAPSCVYCGRKNTGIWSAISISERMLGPYFRFNEIVTIICIVLYILSLALDPAEIATRVGLFSVLAPSVVAVAKLGAAGQWAIANGRVWTYITAIYLHGNLLHIFFNLWWIRQIAPVVKELYGTSRLISIFTISGAIGFVLSSRFTILTIGASGAIFGLLAALIYYGKSRGGTFGTNIYLQVGKWAIILFVFGFIMPRVDNWAHAGGFLGGLVSAMILGYNEKIPEKSSHRILAIIFIGVTIVAFLLTFLTIGQVK